jgi:putative membrane protein
VLSIAIVLYAVSGVFVPAGIEGVQRFELPEMAVALVIGTLLGVLSTLTFAVAESQYPTSVEAA